MIGGESVYPILQITLGNSTPLRGKFYLFKIGLGIHRGMGDCVCFVAIKISALETSDSLFE